MNDYLFFNDRPQQFLEIYNRIMGITKCDTQVALAEYLEMRQSSISDAKKKLYIPSDWYLKLFQKDGINPEWVRTGTGPTHLKNEKGEFVTRYEDIQVTDNIHPNENHTLTIKLPVYIETESKELKDRFSFLREIALPYFLYTKDMIVLYQEYIDVDEKQKRRYIGINIYQTEPKHDNQYILYFEEKGIVIKYLDTETSEDKFLLNNTFIDEFPTYITKEEFSKKVYGKVIWTLLIQ